MNPLLTALNSNGGWRGGSRPPLSTARPGLALKPPKREALAQGGESVERRTGEENVNLGLSPRSFLLSPSCPWQTASAPPVPWPWRWQLAPGPDGCAFIRQPHSLSGEAEWQGPGSRAESEEQRSLFLETGGGEGRELAKNRAARAPRWCPGGAGGRDGGSAGGQWSPGVRWPSTRCPLPKDPHLRTVLRQSIEAQKSVTPAVSPLVPAD